MSEFTISSPYLKFEPEKRYEVQLKDGSIMEHVVPPSPYLEMTSEQYMQGGFSLREWICNNDTYCIPDPSLAALPIKIIDSPEEAPDAQHFVGQNVRLALTGVSSTFDSAFGTKSNNNSTQ